MNTSKNFKKFFKAKRPYLITGASIAGCWGIALWITSWVFISMLMRHNGLEWSGPFNFTFIMYLIQALTTVAIIALATSLYKMYSIKRPLALALLTMGIFTTLNTFIPWIFFTPTMHAGRAGMIVSIISQIIIGALSALLAYIVAAKIRKDTVIYLISVTLIVAAQILPMYIVRYFYS